jgi:hypothetical protein
MTVNLYYMTVVEFAGEAIKPTYRIPGISKYSKCCTTALFLNIYHSAGKRTYLKSIPAPPPLTISLQHWQTCTQQYSLVNKK